MYERFTDRARKVMQLANQEAQRFNHEYIGTEHILLGLIKEKAEIATKVLIDLGIDPDEIRDEIEKIIQPGPETEYRGNLSLTPRSKKVVQCAADEAQLLNQTEVSPEHLLLGMIREETGVAGQVLRHRKLVLDRVRNEVLKLSGS
jgi:ATP-dependent Clp protease ATP-binding subunit ClpC